MPHTFDRLARGPRPSSLRTFVGLLCLIALAAAPAAGQCDAPAFNAGVNVEVGLRPLEVVAGDFNGDGRADFVVPAGNSDKLRLLLGQASGVPTVLQLNITPGRVAVADFNRDGKLDLAVTHGTFSTSFVAVHLGDGAGGFQPASDTQLSQQPGYLLAADFNNDSKPDLFAGNSSTNVSLMLLGDGAGGFAPGFNVVVPNNSDGAAGDINNDGRTDLALTNGGNFISVAFGDGTGHFGSATSLQMDPSGNAIFGSLAVADLNQDNRLDLIAVGQANGVSVRLNVGAGGFGPVSSFATGFRARAVAVGDFNGDGRTDLVPAGSKTVALLLGDGAGGFGQSVNYTLSQSPVDVATGDTNGDGKTDVLTVNVPPDGSLPNLNGTPDDTATVLLGDGAGRLRYASVLDPGGNPFAVAAGDVTNDGKPDLVFINGDTVVSLMPGNGAGGFGAPIPVSGGAPPSNVIIADADDDGRNDIITTNFSANSFSVIQSNGAGGFRSAAPQSLPGSGPTHVVVNDFDNDGRADLAVSYANSAFVTVLKGGGCVFCTVTNFPVPSGAQQMAVHDFNGDGRLDLAVATINGLAVLLGANPGFNAALTLQPGTNFSTVVAGDFNGDGRADLAAAVNNASTVLLFLGDGQGAFAAPSNFRAGGGPVSMVVADYNGDRHPDLATANGSGTVSVLLGDGAGGFAPQVVYVTPGPVPRSIAVEDFNSDGRPDLAVANQGGNVQPGPNPPPGTAAVLFNSCSAAPLPVPTLSVSNATLVEGNSGTVNANFLVSLSAPSAKTVSVSFYAAPQAASGHLIEPQDIVAAQGRVAFAPGVTERTVTVQLRGDTTDEEDETFNVLLTHPLNANVVKDGLGIIVDDDSPPSATIGDVAVVEGDSGVTAATFTVTLSAASEKPLTIAYAAASGTAAAGTDFVPGVAGTLSFSFGQTTRQIVVSVIGDATVEPDETFFVNLSEPLNVTLADAQAQGTILDDDTASFQFSQASYPATEGAHFVTVTVTRAGGLSRAVSVNYATADGTATALKDYTTALGSLEFAAGETSKSFDVLLTDDGFQEGDETINLTLSNPSGGTTLGARSSAVVVIAANDTPPPQSNPIDETAFFVRQHYHDFFSREPDAPGLAHWINVIESCGADAQCREVTRINVSGAFFLSIEFQQTGFLVQRAYKSAYGDATGTSTLNSPHTLTVPIIRLEEFLPDTQRIGRNVIVNQGDWQGQLEANKRAYFLEFVQRQRFIDSFPLSLSPVDFVDRLNGRAGGPLDASERQALIDELTANNTTAGRASVLRKVAEDPTLEGAEKNKAFVLMQYFGYLRRNPNEGRDTDYTGYDFWLGNLERFNGNFVQAELVRAFISSEEYRQRFGQ